MLADGEAEFQTPHESADNVLINDSQALPLSGLCVENLDVTVNEGDETPTVLEGVERAN